MKKGKNSTYVLYLVILVVILSVLYYAINNYLLLAFFKSTVSWLESVAFAVIITFIYEYVFPRVSGKKRKAGD